MRIQFRVKNQSSGLDDLLIDNGTKDNCHIEVTDDIGHKHEHVRTREALAKSLDDCDYPLEAGDTIHLVDLDE